MKQPAQQEFDVVIVGGGIVGLSFACELVSSDFSVAVIERNELKEVTDTPDCRVSAINRFALKRYGQDGKQANVWQSTLSKRACVFDKMFVWDQTGAGQIQFDSVELGVAELGVIIENNVLQQLLLETVKSADNITYLCPDEIIEIDYRPEASGQTVSTITLSSGAQLTAQLLVGADGANSKVRDIANIAAREAPALGITGQTALEYLTRNLHFTMGSAERSGLALFHRLASRIGLAPQATVLRYHAATGARGVDGKPTASIRP